MEEKKKKALDFTKLKKENFVVIFLIGILLLVIAWPTEDEKFKKDMNKSGITDISSSIMESTDGESVFLSAADNEKSTNEVQAYTNFLERTLEDILSSMEGAGEVKVMITLKSSEEAIVERDTVRSRTSSTEVDAEGGSRNTAADSETEETVFTDEGSGVEAPFVKQIIYPQIEGVVVCAQGGGNAAVNKNITEVIQALFGIDVHKIKVIKMSSR